MRNFFFAALCLFVIAGCGSHHDTTPADGGGNPDGMSGGHVRLKGGAQKGPYQSGSPVVCTQLDPQADPTGTSYNTSTDETGMFSISVDPGVYDCQATGFYYREDQGKYSGATTVMHAVVNVKDGDAGVTTNSVFINPRTQFMYKRVLALIGSGTDPDQAIVQAEGEVNDMGFSIPPPSGLPLSTSMNLLAGDGADVRDATREIFRVDCALMYASQIKASDPAELDAQLQSLLNRGALELANGGVFSTDLKSLIAQAEQLMNPQVCKYYLGKYMTDNGLSGTQVPDIDAVVDTDGNGIANSGEPNPGMVLVPAGSFLMGQAQTPTDMPNDFYVDMYEVTVLAYKACVDASACTVPVPPFDADRCNWGVTGREFHPVNCVTWDQAVAYCEWVNGGSKRLPTSAEWEKAARGTDGRTYPWGDTPGPSCQNTVMYDPATGKYGCGPADGTQPVGSKVAGDSPYGARDMAGNVAEWTQEKDWRGGSYIEVDTSYFQVFASGDSGPAPNGSSYGFRCVK